MIRVNLLPHAAERRATPESSQAWLVLVMIIVVVEVAALFLFHETKSDELQAVNDEIARVQSQVTDIQARVKNHDKLKAELNVLRAREDAIAKLQAGRSGPTAVLLELSRILTPNQGPTVDEEKLEKVREENPLAVFNPGWDTKRLWLTDYDEDNRSVRLEGVARDASDVSEFAQRLRMSMYFDDVQLKDGGGTSKSKSDTELVAFALAVKVAY